MLKNLLKFKLEDLANAMNESWEIKKDYLQNDIPTLILIVLHPSLKKWGNWW